MCAAYRMGTGECAPLTVGVAVGAAVGPPSSRGTSVWNSEQPDQALKEKRGEEMKSDHTWDLGAEGGQQRLLIPTAGVTAAYVEQAHKLTLNASSDIFARCSNLRI